MHYEVIEGELSMAPAPSPKHQRAISALFGRLVVRGHAYAPLGLFATGDQIQSEVLAEFMVAVDEVVP
jgi:hypothetical protein